MIKSQSGNVLVYILIAVALLAALSYSVAYSGRGNATKLNAEKAALYATEIIEYSNILAQSVSQVRLRGYKDSEVSFENDIVAGYANANCIDDDCEIFNINGGGVSYSAPKSEWLDSTNSVAARYGELYFHGATSAIEVGVSDDDLIVFIPYIKKNLCIALNKRLAIKPSSDDVPSEVSGPFDVDDKFVGTYGGSLDRTVSGDATTGETDILNGKMSGCTEGSGNVPNPAIGTYHYYQVLIAR